MIEQGHSPKEIWVNLMDTHEISIPYGIIRQYVWNRTLPDSGPQTLVSTNPVHPGHRLQAD